MRALTQGLEDVRLLSQGLALLQGRAALGFLLGVCLLEMNVAGLVELVGGRCLGVGGRGGLDDDVVLGGKRFQIAGGPRRILTVDLQI